jgi:hypothetical protein
MYHEAFNNRLGKKKHATLQCVNSTRMHAFAETPSMKVTAAASGLHVFILLALKRSNHLYIPKKY